MPLSLTAGKKVLYIFACSFLNCFSTLYLKFDREMEKENNWNQGIKQYLLKPAEEAPSINSSMPYNLVCGCRRTASQVETIRKAEDISC